MCVFRKIKLNFEDTAACFIGLLGSKGCFDVLTLDSLFFESIYVISLPLPPSLLSGIPVFVKN